MEIIDLAEKRKAFLRRPNRYSNPHREAMRLRLLWTYDRPPSKYRDANEVRELYKEILKLAVDHDRLNDVYRLITKGLSLDPKFHPLYALRGDLYARQDKWQRAIQSYEKARLMAKLDKKLSAAEANTLYNRQLIETYRKRADWNRDNDALLKAVADYEQILVLRPHDAPMTDVEDTLLETLRRLDKYEAFHFHISLFMKEADDLRASSLLAQHAAYKIYLQEICTARQMLFKALELDKSNARASELLQIVYDIGYTMAAFTAIWCMHGCYDKALMTIEKSRDCDPQNPGYNLLKTIGLRLSGRLTEAEAWLDHVDKNFGKLLEPSRKGQGSIISRLSVKETRSELIKQWYLIRYDMAFKCIADNKHNEAARIIEASSLKKHFMEPYMLLGDSLLKQGDLKSALDMYLSAYDKCKELKLADSQKKIDLIERIVNILNDYGDTALNESRAKDAMRTSAQVLQILNENKVELHRLRVQRGQALLKMSRGLLQSSSKKHINKMCCETAADSLRFVRGTDDAGLYRVLFGEMELEKAIDRFALERKLPQSLKIAM